VVFRFVGVAAGRRAARKALDGALPYATDVRSVKFLFLPPEHDPDSFIREFGRDAFSRYVADATPLSRFLIESAREGCDLNTAEGRAHLAANAKPLWSLLPEGALKRQLLAEIGELVQLGARELDEVWNGKPARSDGKRYQKGSSPRNSGAAYSPKPPRNAAPRVAGRALPAGRAGRALQIVLTDPHAWERLSHDDHQLLCELPAPHGPLFAWLDAQHHDHGAQPWEQLREALRGHEHEDFAVAELARMPPDIESDPAELANILAMERRTRLTERMGRLAAAAPSSPEAFAEYQALLASLKAGAQA
jgi:DNA primase